MPEISMINAALRDEFLVGTSGDCVLRFTIDGSIVVEKRLESAIVRHIPHFKRQFDFQEGQQKVYALDITDFAKDISIDAKEFVHLSLLVVFDESAVVDENVNLKTRYAIVEFREYLDLPYEPLLKVPLPDIRPEDRELYKHVLEKSGGRMFEMLLEHHFKILRQRDKYKFHEQWKEAYTLMVGYITREDVRAKSVFLAFYNRYMCDSIHCLGNGPVELFALMLEFGSAIPQNVRGVANDIAQDAVQDLIDGKDPLKEGSYLSEAELLKSDIFHMKSDRYRRHAHTALIVFLNEVQHFLRYYTSERLENIKSLEKPAKRELREWSKKYFKWCVDVINNETLGLYKLSIVEATNDDISMTEPNSIKY